MPQANVSPSLVKAVCPQTAPVATRFFLILDLNSTSLLFLTISSVLPSGVMKNNYGVLSPFHFQIFVDNYSPLVLLCSNLKHLSILPHVT